MMDGTGSLTSAIQAAQTETVACPVCGHAEYRKYLRVPDRFKPEKGYQFSLVACGACEFVFLNPRPCPGSIGAYYGDEAYQPFLSRKEGRSLWDALYAMVRSRAVRNKRRKIEQWQASGRLLDVGCGTGEFLDEMQRHGWEVAGIEKDEAAAAFAGSAYGLNVETSDLQACSLPDSSCDVITLWHVLEHLYGPADALRKAAALLKPDGLLLVAVPNIASLDFRFYRENWVALDAPRHFHHFRQADMERLCDAAGLALVDTHQMVLDAFYNCILSEALKVRMEQRSPIWLLPGSVRAGLLATLSVANASFRKRLDPGKGSSVLYCIRPGRNI